MIKNGIYIVYITMMIRTHDQYYYGVAVDNKKRYLLLSCQNFVCNGTDEEYEAFKAML